MEFAEASDRNGAFYVPAFVVKVGGQALTQDLADRRQPGRGRSRRWAAPDASASPWSKPMTSSDGRS